MGLTNSHVVTGGGKLKFGGGKLVAGDIVVQILSLGILPRGILSRRGCAIQDSITLLKSRNESVSRSSQ